MAGVSFEVTYWVADGGSGPAPHGAPAIVLRGGEADRIALGPATAGQYFVVTAGDGGRIAALVNDATNFDELGDWARSDQRWTLGPLNAGARIEYDVTVEGE